MNAADRRRHMAIVSMVAGAREYGWGAGVELMVDEHELAEVRDIVTSVISMQPEVVVRTKNVDQFTDSYVWRKDCKVDIRLTARRAPRAEVIPLDAKRQERQLEEQLRASIRAGGGEPDPNFQPPRGA